jgi:hypothetical protein
VDVNRRFGVKYNGNILGWKGSQGRNQHAADSKLLSDHFMLVSLEA